MATQADVNAALAELEDLANDLSKWFTGIGVCFRRLSDPMAQRGMELSAGGAKSAALLGAGISSVVTTLQSFYTANPPGGGVTIYTSATEGVDVVTFGGGTGENNTSAGITGKAWVTADTIVIGDIPYSPLTSDPPSYFFRVLRNSLNIGDGFDFEVYNAGTPSGVAYDIDWVAVVPA